MATDRSLTDTLGLVQNAITTNNYKLALNNLKSLHFVFNKNDFKYSYLISLENSLKKLKKMYYYGGNSTEMERTLQFAESYIGMLKN